MNISFGVEKSMPQKGRLTVDSEGYYSVVLGAFNVTSRNGPFYELSNKVKVLFGPGSTLETRLNQGIVESEYDHPDYSLVPGNTVEEVNANYMQRLLKIDSTLVGGVFKNVKLVPTKNIEYGSSEAIIEVHGKFKPRGPRGAEIKGYLDDPEVNTAFSLRCWRVCSENTGRKVCQVTIPITWDFVPPNCQPGIAIATKEHSIGLEKLMSTGLEVTTESLSELCAGLESIHDKALEEQISTLLNECRGNACMLNF